MNFWEIPFFCSDKNFMVAESKEGKYESSTTTVKVAVDMQQFWTEEGYSAFAVYKVKMRMKLQIIEINLKFPKEFHKRTSQSAAEIPQSLFDGRAQDFLRCCKKYCL